jgi:hypothetical protein
VTLMISGGLERASLARETVFAAVIITCDGIVGIALSSGSALPRHDVQRRGNRHRPGHGDHPGHLEFGTADLHPGSPRSGVHSCAAGLCSYRLTRAVRNVRPDADGSAPRLLPSFDIRRRRRGSRRTRTGCTSGPNPDQSQPGVRLCRPASDSPSPRSPSPRFGWMVPSCWDSIPRRCCCRQ